MPRVFLVAGLGAMSRMGTTCERVGVESADRESFKVFDVLARPAPR